jgi:PTH1 family peptidyl-tRNA hydrolase
MFSTGHVLIVGLGNPGSQYARTRHNVGFNCVDRLAESYGWTFSRQQSKALLASGLRGELKITLAKPMTYMNLSGQSVASLAHFYKIEPQDILVICDDLDLPLGRIRLRPSGGSAGQKGMVSIMQSLGTDAFPRLRIGIGRPYDEAVGHVLGRFSEDDAITISRIYDWAVDAVSVFLADGVEAAMNQFNGLGAEPDPR